VNREIPFAGTRWTIDHAETISERNIERVRALGGGIAVQDRVEVCRNPMNCGET
jgi:hypothetical protein